MDKTMTQEQRDEFNKVCDKLLVTRESERIAFRAAMAMSWNAAVRKCAETANVVSLDEEAFPMDEAYTVEANSILKNLIPQGNG